MAPGLEARVSIVLGLAADVKSHIEDLPDVEEAKVEVVLDPPWNQNMMTEAAKLQLGFL
ncbi:MAG: hypothetical protein IH936_06940 [Acidobacteria bacterium]|nr:hypothetical protein [Acidobacteriota bacterium]